MNNSKSKQLDRNKHSKSKPPEKQNRAQKTSKKKHDDADNPSSSSRKQDDLTPSTSRSYTNTLEQPLTRRPLRNTSNEDTIETVYAESNHIPRVLPKREKPDAQRKTFSIARDPRMTEKPIMERDDDMEEDISNEAFPPDFANDESVSTESFLQSVIDINLENVKNENGVLGLEENSDWKSQFLNKENTTTENPITVPAVRIKSEPIDESDFNATSEPIEDDRCSIDSSSTVGLPSPGRSSPSLSPKPSEENQTASDILNENETSKISPEEQLTSTEHKDGEEEDPLPNPLPTTTNSTSAYYSAPTDLEEEYRKLEREKAAAETAAAAASKEDYSRENTDMSSDDEMPMLTTSHTNRSFSEDDDFGNDDDGEQFCDYYAEKDPSWASSEPSEDIRAGQKRPLPNDEAADINGTTNLAAKKSRFQVHKFTQDSTDSLINQSNPVDDVPSTSTPRSPASSSNTETPLPSSEMESSAQPVTDGAKDQSSTRTRLPVKLTTTNRASMMVEDFLNSANINAARIPNKRAKTPTKTTPKRKKQLSGNRSTPPPPSQPTNVDFSDNVPGVRGIRENDLTRQQNLLAITSGSRDPRIRSRRENEASSSSSSMNQSNTPSSMIANLSRALKIKILMRVLKLWQFKWIEQQAKLKIPPPLLDEDKYYPSEIPKLSCVPVLTKYRDFPSYCNIFQPLMLHEMWSTLVLQNRTEKNDSNWKCSIKSATKEDSFLLLHCLLLLEYETEAPAVNDLVVMTFTRATGELILPFGFVEDSKTTKKFKIADFDSSLMPKNKSKVNYAAEIVIRIIKNYAPKNAPGQKDMIASIAKVASLTLFMDLFHAQAAFGTSPLRDIVLQPRPFAFQVNHNRPSFSMDFMDQKQTDVYFSIAQSMLMSKKDEPNKIAILQGYPGTGKTHVIVYIIQHIAGHKFSDGRNKILYCAPTNAAVDEMIRRLLVLNRKSDANARFDVLRIGNWARLHPDVKEVTLEDKLARLRGRIKHENPARKELHILNEKLVHLKNLKESIIKEISQHSHSLQRSEELENKLSEVSDEIKTATALLEDTKKIQEEEVEKVLQDHKRLIISQADVICTTLEACSSTDLGNIFIDPKRDSNGEFPRPFLCCIIDDASLCTEPQTLIPLALGVKNLILVGDLELLPFNLNSSEAKNSRLNQSLFSRFHSSLSNECSENERPIFSFNTQFRMVPEICQWTSKYYYGNRLQTSLTLKSNSPLHAYRVLDVRDSREKLDGRSNFVNEPEAEVIVKILECMLHSPSMAGKTIGIITFYDQQRLFIRHQIKERLPKDYTRTEVRLVQDFQGSEMDVVLISCVKTEIRESDNLAILTDYWNVAVTRAIESLFICGNLKALENNEVLKDLISDANKRQVIHRVSSKFERSMLYDTLTKPTDYMEL